MPLTTAPSSPTELTATSQTPTSAELTWQDSEREDGYRIYRLDGEQRVLIGTAESNATRFTVGGLTPRTEYRFVVEAYNADGAAASTSPAVTPVASDEHGDTRQTATPLTAPASLSSFIDHAGDLDMFSIRVEAGTTYVFSTTLGNQATSLRDSVIELFDAEGRRLGINDDFGGTLASRLAWTAPASLDGQSVYLQVRGYSRSQSGDYGLNIEVARPIADDHGNSITTASALSGPTSLNASIERGGDIDMFSLRVVGGTTYTFSTTLGNSAGSLRDSVIELFDAQGSRLGINDDFGGTLASRLSWTAPAEFDGQRIYLGVRAYSRAQTGTYALNVTTAIPVPATPDVTTPSVTIGSHTIGNIATAGSTNQFRLDVTAGQRVEVLTQLLTLRDSTITVTNSRGQRLAYNDDDAGTLASRVELTATQTETWIIAVRGYAAYQTGSYRLLVRSR